MSVSPVKRIIFGMAFISQVLILGACSISAGDKKSSSADNTTESYKYEMTCNGCKTNAQTFSSHGDYCAGLLDEGRNNSCCRYEREQVYKQNCQ